MEYDVSSNNIRLKSSYEVSKEDFERELLAIREQHPDSLVWNRSIDSLKREWAVHNAKADCTYGFELASKVVY